MRKREIDPNSRDYEFSEIEPDERFVQTAKEFWVTIGTFCVFTVLMILNLYMVNGPDRSIIRMSLVFRSGFSVKSAF